jgi:glycosyltransferase involved in cell wall biosynthesis
VHFEGARPNIEMPSYLSSAEVVVIPSLMEATSVAGLEAMSCERAIVASDVGGLPEIVSNDTGRLVPPQDPGALARAVSELLELPEESRRRMGKIARDRVVENWSVENLARQVLEYYNEATDIFASEKA